MTESLTPPARKASLPPVVAELLSDSVGLKHLNENIARSVAAAAAPFAEMQAKLGARIGADLLTSLAPFNARVSADIAAVCARAFPAIEPIPDELFIAMRRSPMAVAIDRFEAVVIREVRPVAAHTSNIDQSVLSIAKSREWDKLTLILALVSTVAVVVGTIFGVLLFTR